MIFIRKCTSIALYFLLIMLIPSLSKANQAPSLTVLCGNPIPLGDTPATPMNPYPIPDHLVRSKQYSEALRAYLQIFRCANMPLSSGLNPVVTDEGALIPFDKAMTEAISGRYQFAEKTLQITLRHLPTFGEARLIMGVCFWATGDRHAARLSWESTKRSMYFTQPPDSGPPLVFAAAERLLDWSK